MAGLKTGAAQPIKPLDLIRVSASQSLRHSYGYARRDRSRTRSRGHPSLWRRAISLLSGGRRVYFAIEGAAAGHPRNAVGELFLRDVGHPRSGPAAGADVGMRRCPGTDVVACARAAAAAANGLQPGQHYDCFLLRFQCVSLACPAGVRRRATGAAHRIHRGVLSSQHAGCFGSPRAH